MKKRWLIRSLFLLPLLCVVAVWVASYFRGISAGVDLWGRSWYLETFRGLGIFADVPAGTYPDQLFLGPKTLGFYMLSTPGVGGDLMIGFPLWFPTLILSALCWLVWRKTRPKPQGRAFPIEPTNSPANSK